MAQITVTLGESKSQVSTAATSISYSKLLAKLEVAENGTEGLKLLKSSLPALELNSRVYDGGYVDDSTHGETPENRGIYIDLIEVGYLYLLNKKSAPRVHRLAHVDDPFVILLDKGEDGGPFTSYTLKSVFIGSEYTQQEAIDRFIDLASKLSNAKNKKEVNSILGRD